jgi:hypothetical protein
VWNCLEPSIKFCNECDYKLNQEIDPTKTEYASNGERKHVTVLFSDLSGLTAMSERLDPEEVKEITPHPNNEHLMGYSCIFLNPSS